MIDHLETERTANFSGMAGAISNLDMDLGAWALAQVQMETNGPLTMTQSQQVVAMGVLRNSKASKEAKIQVLQDVFNLSEEFAQKAVEEPALLQALQGAVLDTLLAGNVETFETVISDHENAVTNRTQEFTRSECRCGRKHSKYRRNHV